MTQKNVQPNANLSRLLNDKNKKVLVKLEIKKYIYFARKRVQNAYAIILLTIATSCSNASAISALGAPVTHFLSTIETNIFATG